MSFRKSNAPRLFALFLAAMPALLAQSQHRYAIILDDPPVMERFVTREASTDSLAGRSYKAQIVAKQQALQRELTSRNIQVTSSVSTVLNAVFVVAPQERLAELQALPGVKGVVEQRRYKLKLNAATKLVNAPAAWTTLSGIQNAGVGMRIAIIDTGIDSNHPIFQDGSLKAPSGFPVCKATYPNNVVKDIPNCSAYTNNKVIVARSYVPLLAAGTDPNNPAVDSHPDDYTPRDRVGHGTGTASCAAGENITAPQFALSGMAPKAFLGNYKVFGSPDVNDFTFDEPMVNALEDALADHMDVASMSIGGLPVTGPLDTGAACGQPSGTPCDLVPTVIETVVKGGMVVAVSAGNDADSAGVTFNQAIATIESPADAPSSIAVGASDNSHFMTEGVEVPGAGVPSNLQLVPGALGDGVFLIAAVGAPLVDVSKLGNDGLACSALPAGSLNGAFALIQRGTCNFSVKGNNAQNAGAAGVIFYMADQSNLIFPAGLSAGGVTIPTIMIPNNQGVALKSYIGSNPGHLVHMSGSLFENVKTTFDLLAGFSSIGPSLGDNALKPDLVAPGGSDGFYTEIFFAVQSYDPLGDLFSSDGYAAASGTSFSTPIVAGAAALVKQAHPNFTALQIKSALVNTAAQTVTQDEFQDTVSVPALGGGRLDVGAAIQTTVTANPVSVSFGVPGTLPVSKAIQLTNTGSGSVTLSLGVTQLSTATAVNVALDQQSLSLAAGASGTVNLALSGSAPKAGSYYGFVTVQGGAVPLRIPYLFLTGTGTVDNMLIIAGGGDGTPGQDIGPVIVRLIDSFGLPVANAPVTFTASNGATLQNASTKTDAYGVAQAESFLGPNTGSYNFSVNAGGLFQSFPANARAVPTIAAANVVNAASFEVGKPVAPGSYVSFFGSALSDQTGAETTSVLPITVDPCFQAQNGNCAVTVSFDVPSAGISVPGHMVYVSAGQLNLQIPWELQGQTSAQTKVTINRSFGNVVTIPLSDYAPAFFEIGGGNVAARDLTGNVIGTSNPAKQGSVVQLYANALGPLSNQPASGDPAPSSPLATCKGTATVSVGNKPATVSFCGLAPGFAGLYQVNAAIPTGLTTGSNPITVSIGGQTSKTSNIVVQ